MLFNSAALTVSSLLATTRSLIILYEQKKHKTNLAVKGPWTLGAPWDNNESGW